MTRGVPVLDPKVRLKGATPEKLAKALLRPLRPVGKTVGSDQVTVKKMVNLAHVLPLPPGPGR
ncbi:MAG: hypothetical protein OXC93_01850 [Rhodospirillaceae bacterium]|nr:hypothetical protein [Rhodospirillaceae bacterium]